MNLSDEQKKTVSSWLEQGLKVAEVQGKLGEEFDVHMTYMEVRFLLDDLRLNPKDPEEPEPEEEKPEPPAADAVSPDDGFADADGFDEAAPPADESAPAGTGNVNVTVDTITRPGSLASGKVTFSDGKTAAWYFDQFGRLGVIADDKSYKPSQNDVMEFQQKLQGELARLGI